MTTSIYIHQDSRVIHKKSVYKSTFPLEALFCSITNLAIRRCFEWPLHCTNDFWAFIGTSLDEHAATQPPLGSQLPHEKWSVSYNCKGFKCWILVGNMRIKFVFRSRSQFFQWNMKSNYNSHDYNNDRPVSWNALLSSLGWELLIQKNPRAGGSRWGNGPHNDGRTTVFSRGFFSKCDSQIYPGHVGRTCSTILCKWEPPTINWSREIESSPQLCRFKFRNSFDLSRHEKVKHCQMCYVFSSSHQNGWLRCFVNPQFSIFSTVRLFETVLLANHFGWLTMRSLSTQVLVTFFFVQELGGMWWWVGKLSINPSTQG